MIYDKIMFKDTNPNYCYNCGESENYKKQEVLNDCIEMIYCYTCNNKTELVNKGDVYGKNQDKNK